MITRAIFMATVLVAAMSVACGFHLRGPVELPSSLLPLYVDTSAVGHELAQELDLLFRSSKVALTDNKEQAAAILEILQARKSRRVLSVDSSGRVQEYELTFELQYRIQGRGDSQDAVGSELKTIELKKDLLFDPTSVLAVGYETETLYRDMASDSARLILQQLRAMTETENVKPDPGN